METVCERFNELQLHDSRFVDVSILRRTERESHEVRVDLEIERETPGGFSSQAAKLVFIDCTFLKIDLDLDGKVVCGDAIARSRCTEHSELREALERGPLKYEDSPLEGYFHFSIFLIPPGGEMHVFARDFALTFGMPS